MRILAISGSLRADSVNTALLNALQSCAGAAHSIVLFDGLAHLPIFSPDLESPRLPGAVAGMIKAITLADALVIASPEYARTIPGGLKNALDWLVSGDQVIHKPIALLHASLRGDEMLTHLRRVLETVSTGFAPDIFARFSLPSRDPIRARQILQGTEIVSELSHFLHDLSAFVQSRQGVPADS